MQTKLKIQLSIFMFLQYFIWGRGTSAWEPIWTRFVVQRRPNRVGIGAFAIGAMISQFFIGLVADRYFGLEKLLGIPWHSRRRGDVPASPDASVRHFLPNAHSLLCPVCPDIGPGNSLSMHHLRDAKRDFPQVKILSAVGWIVGGVMLSLMMGSSRRGSSTWPGASRSSSGFSPSRSPTRRRRRWARTFRSARVLGLDALALLKKPSFAILSPACSSFALPPLFLLRGNVALCHGAGMETRRRLVGAGPSLRGDLHCSCWRDAQAPRGQKDDHDRHHRLGRPVLPAVRERQFGADRADDDVSFAAIRFTASATISSSSAGQLYVDAGVNERMRGPARGSSPSFSGALGTSSERSWRGG